MALVSVIIPTHDRPQMLREAVDSVLAQTFQDFEIIIVLNGASAASIDMGRRLSSNPKVRVIEMEDSSLAASRNYGLTSAESEWVAFLDDDDIWHPEKLELQLAAAAQTGADLVTCNFGAFNDKGEIADAGLAPRPPGLNFAEALMLDNFVSGGSSVIVKRAVICRRGGFDASLRGCEDWDMWRRLAWDAKFHYLDRRLVRYRRHGANMTDRLDLVLQAETQHFAKLLVDTPPELRHMLPLAKRRFFWQLSGNLTQQGILDTYRILGHNIVFSACRILTKSVGGLAAVARRVLRATSSSFRSKRPPQRI